MFTRIPTTLAFAVITIHEVSMYYFLLALVVALLAYLMRALLRPERF